jgi:hypothetical protein
MESGGAEAADSYFDTTGNSLRRRINWTLLGISVAVLLLIAVLVLQAISNANDATIEDSVSSAKVQFSALQAAMAGSPVAASAITGGQFLQCSPAGSSSTVPKTWVILGDSSFIHGLDGVNNTDAYVWYQQMLALISSGASAYHIFVPAGNSVAEQLAALQADPDFDAAVIRADPLMVFYESGYVGSLAALAAQLNEYGPDARAAKPTQIAQNDMLMLSSAWWFDKVDRVVVLVPSLPYSPSLGAFVPASITVCSDPLAASLFNDPDSLGTQMLLSQLPSTLTALHLINAVYAKAAGSQASIQILPLGTILNAFTFNAATSPENVAFAPDCLSLNRAGQRLLARYLWSCVNGVSFQVPVSLADI